MNLIKLGSNETMSSLDFLNDIVNPVRVEFGEPEIRNNVFVARIEDELDDLGGYKTFVTHGNEVKGYNLTVEQMALVGMRESKGVRKKVLQILKDISTPKTPQSFADALQLAADQAKQLELAAPKVKYFDTVADRKNLLNATQVGQKVGLSAVTLNKILAEFDVYNKNVKRSRVFKTWFVEAGYGELKQTELGHSQAMFTQKGEQWVIAKLSTNSII